MRKKANIILILVVLTLGISSKNLISIQNNNNNRKENPTPKISGYWVLPYIHVNGNWSYTVGNYSWCSGDGSWQNPFTIENVIINASASPTGVGILIRNSKQNYFEIRNCTVYNGGTGIKLENSTNGQLKKNNFSFNSYGVHIYNHCVNNTIVGNTINDNTEGIRIGDSVYAELYNRSSRVFILENTINRNVYGIRLIGCSNSTISRNSINWNTNEGIYLSGNGDTIISENYFTFNDDVIVLWTSYSNLITGNVISNNSGDCITLEFFCENNTIVGNLIYNNTGYGILNRNTGVNNEANQMVNNYLAQGAIGANARDQVIEHWGNVWYNSEGGNYWDDYTGSDANGDGIGDSYYIIHPEDYGIDRKPLMNYPVFFSEKPTDMIYEIGTTNHALNWTVVHPKPLSYEILRNGSSVKTGILSSQIEDIGISVDTLLEGDHLYTLEIEQTAIVRPNSDNVTVRVNNENPFFTQKPGSRSYEQGQTGNFLSWTFSDISTINPTYSIYRDGSPVISDNSCAPGLAIDFNIDGLFTGVYEFTIEIDDGYGRTVQDIVQVGVTSSLSVEIVDQFFSEDKFNITYRVRNQNDQGIDFATTQVWWNGTDVSTDVQNLGGGLYILSLNPITVALGEAPILLNFTVSASGYAEKHFEMYIAVDPETLAKDEDASPDELPPIIIVVTLSSAFVGLAAVGVIILFLRKRK